MSICKIFIVCEREGIKIGHICPKVFFFLFFFFAKIWEGAQPSSTSRPLPPFIRLWQAPIFFCVWYCIRINWRLNERLRRSDLSPDLNRPKKETCVPPSPLMIYGPDFQGFSLRSINYWHPSLDSPLSLLICDKWQSVSLSVGVGRVMPSPNSGS